MPRLALLSMNPPILDPDYHRIAAGVEVGTLCYLTSRPPLRMLRDLSPFHRAILMGAVYYGYESYIGTRSVPVLVSDADTVTYATY